MWLVYSGEVRSEVGTRSRMCYVGWVVWVHGFCLCNKFYTYLYHHIVVLDKYTHSNLVHT